MVRYHDGQLTCKFKNFSYHAGTTGHVMGNCLLHKCTETSTWKRLQ